MILSDISVRRPIFAAVMSLLLIVIGAMAFLRLPLRELPDIDPPVVSVDTVYPGASAQVIETRITKIIEDQLAGLEGVEIIQSQSRDGRSSVSIEFALERDIEAAANDVRNAVARVQGNLPDDVDPPEVQKADVDAQPIMFFNLAAENMSVLELTDYARRVLVDKLSAVPGVARVNIAGQQRYAMRIWIDRKALAARGLTVSDVESALRRDNVETPAGSLESQARDFTLRIPRNFQTPEEFARMGVGRSQQGILIRLGDVARVERGPAEHRTEVRGNGQRQVGLAIIRQSKANLVDVARAAKEEVANLAKTLPPGMELVLAFDSSIFVEKAVEEVEFTLFIAMALVLAVIYAFLGTVRAALVPAATVPVCIIASFIALYAMGFSINLLTLLALVLAIGIVVDDAIVVLENVQRRMDMGEPPAVAAARGAQQVGFAVIATTTVLVAVFLPIAFLQGNIGRLFSELAVTMAAAVGISGFVALTLTPMMCSKLLKPAAHETVIARLVRGFTDWAGRIYRGSLEGALNAPALILLFFAASVAATVVLFQLVPSELAPEEDTGGFTVSITGPEGASFEYTRAQMLKVEAILMRYIANKEAYRLVTRVPQSFGATQIFNNGQATVFLADWAERSRSLRTIIDEVTPLLSQIPGVRANANARQSLGQRGGGRPVSIILGGNSYEELAEWRDRVLARIAENPGLTAADSDYRETKPQILVQVDRERAADLGVSVSAVGRTLQTLMGSQRVTTYNERGEDYDVILQADPQDRRDANDLTNTYVRSERSGTLVPLSNLVTTKEVASAGTLNRFNRARSIAIQAGLGPGYSLGEALSYLEQVVKEELPPTARLDYGGQSREFRRSSADLYFTFALALLVVYLVLAAQFESFIHPLIILVTVPLAVAGALLGLFVYGSTMNIYSQIGIVMLVGLAAKNGILIVEFANQLRDEGMALREALLEACAVRLRPILMTSIATVAGAIPLILEGGPGSASRETIGVVVVAGVSFATFLSLFVVPCFYQMLAPYTRPAGTIGREMDEWERKNA